MVATMLAANWQMMLSTRIRDVADLDGILVPWKRLVGQSLAPAGLNSPELIVPLLKKLPGGELAVVMQGKDLLFALPMGRRRSFCGLVSNWITPLTVIGAPHLDRDVPVAALTSFINSLKHPLLLHSINVNGRLWDHLASRDAQFSVIDVWYRAALRPKGTYEEWLEKNFDRKRRKEYRRLTNRLSEQGRYETVTFQAGEDCRPWADDILGLEASGWKGKRGTAVAANEDLREAFTEAIQHLAASGKLRFWKLVLGGRAIASMYAIVEGNEAWLGKIAYDEEFSKYSPGVLLILHATQQLFGEPSLMLIDTCAIPGHPMIENIWRDRIEMANVMIAPKSISTSRFALAVSLEGLRRSLRAKLANAYYHLRGEKRS
jgi:CelD/BcsL family acetyltransferase involved in cellulose biosynthesis